MAAVTTHYSVVDIYCLLNGCISEKSSCRGLCKLLRFLWRQYVAGQSSVTDVTLDVIMLMFALTKLARLLID